VDLAPWLGPVRDQGPRGTCLAFAVTAAHEWSRQCRRAVSADLSEEYLHWATKGVDGNRSSGTSCRSMATALLATGQCDAKSWPYRGDRDETSSTYEPPADAGVSLWRAGLSRRTSSALDDIRADLDRGLVSVLIIDIWKQFYKPVNGVLTAPAPADLLGTHHAVLAVGYSASDSQLLIRNSWSDTWGNTGQALMPFAAWAIAGINAWVVEDNVDL
jgi:C1A family cysteine protease